MSTHITTFNHPQPGGHVNRTTLPTKPVRLISFGNSPPPSSPLGSPPGGGGLHHPGTSPDSPMVLVAQTAAYSSPPPHPAAMGLHPAHQLHAGGSHPANVSTSAQSHIYIEVRGTTTSNSAAAGGLSSHSSFGGGLPPSEPDYLSPDGGGGGSHGQHQLTDIKTEPLPLFRYLMKIFKLNFSTQIIIDMNKLNSEIIRKLYQGFINNS